MRVILGRSAPVRGELQGYANAGALCQSARKRR